MDINSFWHFLIMCASAVEYWWKGFGRRPSFVAFLQENEKITSNGPFFCCFRKALVLSPLCSALLHCWHWRTQSTVVALRFLFSLQSIPVCFDAAAHLRYVISSVILCPLWLLDFLACCLPLGSFKEELIWEFWIVFVLMPAYTRVHLVKLKVKEFSEQCLWLFALVRSLVYLLSCKRRKAETRWLMMGNHTETSESFSVLPESLYILSEMEKGTTEHQIQISGWETNVLCWRGTSNKVRTMRDWLVAKVHNFWFWYS